VADGVANPLLGVTGIPSGVEALSQAGNAFTLANSGDVYRPGTVSSPGVFRDVGDFMTGGNRTHNAEVDQLITQEAIRLLEEARGESFGAERRAEVRRYVHDLLPSYKQNAGGQRNGNVDPSDFSEILDHTLEHFGLRTRREGPRVIESSEDMHWRIEELIEHELMLSASWNDPNLETIRATLRTRLRAEFSQILMNEWGSENLEDINDFLRGGIVADFETRAFALMPDVLASSTVCTATDSEPSPAAPVVNPWAEVLTSPLPGSVQSSLHAIDPRLAEFFETQMGEATTIGDLLRIATVMNEAIPNQVLADALREGLSLSESPQRVIFELVARSAESRGAWSASDPVGRSSLGATFEASVRRSTGGSGEARVENREDRERREREAREREVRVRP